MKKLSWLGLPIVAFLLTGCIIRSLDPFYTDKDLVYDPALAGTWQGEKEEGDTWEFTGNPAEKSYALVHTDKKGNQAEFSVRLFQLGKTRFLDCVLTELTDSDENLNEISSLHLVPTHSILKVEAIGKELRLSWGSEEKLRNLLKQNPKAIAHHRFGEKDDFGVLLTAPTAELQEFLKKHLDDDLFIEPFTLTPKPAPAAPTDNKPR